MKTIAFTTVLIIFFASTYLLGRIIGTYIFYNSCIAGGEWGDDVFKIGIECSTPLRIIFTMGIGFLAHLKKGYRINKNIKVLQLNNYQLI